MNKTGPTTKETRVQTFEDAAITARPEEDPLLLLSPLQKNGDSTT
jgi:hypothetical protein